MNFKLGLLALVLLLAGFYIPYARKASLPAHSGELAINGRNIKVEVVDTENDRRAGLSGRVSLPRDAGMLFVFPERGKYTFWMKDMHFPLDFIWIDGGSVVDISPNVPVFDDNGAISTLSPSQPVDMVLEISAGVAEDLGVKIGDKVTLP